MNQIRTQELEQSIGHDYGNLAAMVVLKDGQPVYQNYFGGHTSTDTFHVFSITKSIVSILVGIAIDQGYIRDVQQRVLDFFPDYKVKRGEKTIQTVTLENLLTMTAPYKFRSAPYTRVFTQTDWVTATLDLLGGRTPVGQFRYMELIGPDILSGILVRATGRSVLDFAQEFLFGPLGISVTADIVLDTVDKHVAFIRTNNASGWVADENGTHTAGWGLTLTAMEMTKIGQLYLNGGQWAGRQIVSRAWVTQSTAEHSRWTQEDLPYGYLWWVGMGAGAGYAAMGNSGNVIYVNPQSKLVVAAAALFRPTAKDILELIRGQIEPLFGTAADRLPHLGQELL